MMTRPHGGLSPACCAPPATKARPSPRQKTSSHAATSTLTKINSDIMNLNIQIVTLALPILLASCASYGPYHPNTSAQPLNSVRGPTDGRYKLAIIEFGDQGSALDTSQRAAALGMIHEAERPLLFVYLHVWRNH